MADLYPWIVGRETLLEHAVQDFLGELTRDRPWLRARYDRLLGELEAWLSAELGRPAPLAALDRSRAAAWLATLPEAERPDSEAALGDLAEYAVGWRWLAAAPWVEPAVSPQGGRP